MRDAIDALGSGDYDVLCVTSPNGAALLMDAFADADLDNRALAGVTVAAIGPGTATALLERGIAADLIPPRSIAESLAQEIIAHGRRGQARADRARRRGPGRAA